MALLDVQNLSIGYQTVDGELMAVENISFSIEKGKSLGFVGESGCGKTTLGMALMRILPPNGYIRSGRILFDGEDLLQKSDDEMRRIRWNKIAMIFQAAMNALNPVHRVENQIEEAILTHRPELHKNEVKLQVEELFERVGIPKNRLKDYPHQYSGGMKQRAIIAMALACRPQLIIADEPTTALDVIVQDQILQEIKQLQASLNISMLFISHDISVIAEVCDDVGVLYGGHLVEYGDLESVFNSPMHPYTKMLLNSFITVTGENVLPPEAGGETPNLIEPPAGCRFCNQCNAVEVSCRIEAIKWVEITPKHKVLCSRCG